MFKIYRLLMFVFTIIGVFSTRVAWGLVSYSHYVSTGASEQTVEVDYSKEVYKDRQIYSPTVYLIDKFTKVHKPTSEIAKGFDKTMIKDMLELGAAFTTQTAGEIGTAETITLAANAKDNLELYQEIELVGLTSDEDTYTRYVYVSDKNDSDTTTIKIMARNPAHRIGSGDSEEVAAGTLLSCMGSAFAREQGRVKGVSQFATTIDNYYQDFRRYFNINDVAAMNKLYHEGTPENILEGDTRQAFLMLKEKTFLEAGPKYQKKVAAGTDTSEIGKLGGLIYGVKTGGSPAVKSYDTFEYKKFDQWQWALGDPDINDVAGIRQVLCNAAFHKLFYDKKLAFPGFDYSQMPADTYGIPKVMKVRTDRLEMHLIEHPVFTRLYPNMNQPFALALTFPYIEYRPLIKTYLWTNVQEKGVPVIQNCFRSVDTYIIHQPATPFHGILYPTTRMAADEELA